MSLQYLTQKAELDTIMKDFSGVVVLDFYADWCGPCKMLAPIFAELSEEYPEEKVKFIKINTEEAQALSMEFGIMSIPTVVIGVNHELKEGFMGLNQKEFYKEKIDHYLKQVQAA